MSIMQEATPPASTAVAALREEEAEFVPDEIIDMGLSIIDEIIGDSMYSELKVTLWTTSIIERLLTELAKLRKPFKYVINCALQQRTGGGLHMASAMYWDSTVDGAATIKWDNEYIHCCVYVFGVQI